MLAWVLGCSSFRLVPGTPEGPQHIIPQTRLGDPGQEQKGCSVDRGPAGCWRIQRRPFEAGQVQRLELAAGSAEILGIWSLPHCLSLKPTLLVLLTAQMGGKATECSESREENAPLQCKAEAEAGRLCVCVCVCVCVCAPRSLLPSPPSLEMPFQFPSPQRTTTLTSSLCLSPAQPSPAHKDLHSLWFPLPAPEPAHLSQRLRMGKRQCVTKSQRHVLQLPPFCWEMLDLTDTIQTLILKT
jgi:hypothetical protein